MLHTLRAKVKFASTQKVLSFDINFDTGLSSITGPNEVGKSTVLELIRWTLFGSEALRAPATSYESIQGYLELSIKGTRYSVQRTKTTCRVEGPDGPVASGTTHGNEAIIKLFGYGLEVFDIAHFCGQGQVDALTAMKPTKRKAMVDRVIGMEALDAAAATAAAEATTLRAEVKGLELALGGPPQRPPPPAHTTTDVRAALAGLQPDIEQLAAARAWLAGHPQRPEPQKPFDAGLPPAAELRALELARESVIRDYNALMDSLKGVERSEYSAEELDAHEATLVAFSAALDQSVFIQRHGEPPTKTMEQLAAMELAWAHVGMAEEARQTVAALAAGSHTCPECGHSWVSDVGKLLSAEEVIAAYGEVEPPELSLRQIEDMRRRCAAWAGRSAPFITNPVTKAPLMPARIAAQRLALARAEDWERLDMMTLPASVGPKLRERLEYDDAMARFEDRRAEWRGEEMDRQAKEVIIAGLLRAEKEHAEWTALLPICLAYDAHAAAYATLKERYDTTNSLLLSKREELEDAKNAAEAVKTLRTKIKAHLTPSLNVAASNLISTMTGGVRNDIVIDENFESILVDGQPVETLSGSAKAVANLAIRLGLGQVLTNKVFSVFMGDEIDASFDDDRVAYTAECMQQLGGVISQIVLVSHRDLPTQHQIRISNA